MKTKQYKVGDHVFEIQFVDDNNDESLLPSFRPFELKDSDDVPLFRVIVDDSFKFDELGHEIGQFDCGGSNHGVYLLPKLLDEKVARLQLTRLNAQLSRLTEEQAAYIGVPVEGPFKSEHYRY